MFWSCFWRMSQTALLCTQVSGPMLGALHFIASLSFAWISPWTLYSSSQMPSQHQPMPNFFRPLWSNKTWQKCYQLLFFVTYKGSQRSKMSLFSITYSLELYDPQQSWSNSPVPYQMPKNEFPHIQTSYMPAHCPFFSHQPPDLSEEG